MSLQEILHNRITEKKEEIHKPHIIAYTNILWTEIERNIALGLGSNTNS